MTMLITSLRVRESVLQLNDAPYFIHFGTLKSRWSSVVSAPTGHFGESDTVRYLRVDFFMLCVHHVTGDRSFKVLVVGNLRSGINELFMSTTRTKAEHSHGNASLKKSHLLELPAKNTVVEVCRANQSQLIPIRACSPIQLFVIRVKIHSDAG